jgi:DNA polymerase-3 subunit gamma/tau
MSSQVLARKYRPRKFSEMVGQAHVVQALGNALAQGRLHHAYLFTGTRGIGKTTVSRILAKSLNCTGPDGTGGITAEPCGVCSACTEIDADRSLDYVELDAASNRGIDEVRDLIERATYKPATGRFKVFMIDEAHQLTKDAFNALLKTLEEPPEHLKFVLATTDPDKMLPTVLSRCLQFNLKPMAPDTVREHLRAVLVAEQVGFDEGALRLLGRAARGSMRDALSLTDQAIAFGAGTLREDAVRQMLGAVDRSRAAALVQALAARDAVALLAEVDALREHGASASGVLEELALLLQRMAVAQMAPAALDDGDPDDADAATLAAALAADELQLLYSMALHGRDELRLMSDEYAALAMVLLRFLAFPADGGAPPRQEAAPARPARPATPTSGPAPVASQPLRTPAPAALAVPAPVVTPAPVAARVVAASRVEEPVPADPVLGDRWFDIVQALDSSGRIGAMARELALNAGLLRVHAATDGQRWTLQVASELLRAEAHRERLEAALGEHLGEPMALELIGGEPADTPAKRHAAEKRRRQAAAEALIESDPVVQTMLAQYKTARVVPGSVRPA